MTQPSPLALEAFAVATRRIPAPDGAIQDMAMRIAPLTMHDVFGTRCFSEHFGFNADAVVDKKVVEARRALVDPAFWRLPAERLRDNVSEFEKPEWHVFRICMKTYGPIIDRSAYAKEHDAYVRRRRDDEEE